MSKPKYRLCYVEDFNNSGPLQLYFTPLPLDKQRGDDWDDRPYEHNAGRPYEYDYDQPEQGVENGCGIYPEIQIKKILIEARDWKQDLVTPQTNCLNSPYSVNDINGGAIPWVTVRDKENGNMFLRAGMELNTLIKQCLEWGVIVYIRKEKRSE